MQNRTVFVQPVESNKPSYGNPSYTVCIYLHGTFYVYEDLSYNAMCGLYNSSCGILQYIRENTTGRYLR